MRKLNLFFAASFACGALVSCSSDDAKNTNNNISGDIEGRWNFESYRVMGVTVPYDHNDCGKDHVIFSQDMSGKFVSYDECTPETVIDEDAFTYEKDGNSLEFIQQDGTHSATIKKLTETDMELKFSYDFDGDGDNEEVTEIFVKQ